MVERQESYEVHIGVFEGPMDLLLYLVQKNEVHPGQISIAEITDQYLAWIRDLSKADLSLAGDFLLMASRLMALKVRELLPKDQQTEADQLEFEEGREQLLQQMLEYQRFKYVAADLQRREGDHHGTFYRGRPEKTSGDDDTLADANVWQLFRAFQKSLKVHGRENVHTIELDDVTIEDRQQHIHNYLARHGRALFEDLLGRDRRPLVAVVSFMALLEMIKTDDIVFRQSEAMGALWLYRRKNNQDFAEEMASEKIRYSNDPDLKPGLVELLRGREAAQEGQKRITLDGVMREAVLWASSGRAVSDDVLMGMLEGRVQLEGDAPAAPEATVSETPVSDAAHSDATASAEPASTATVVDETPSETLAAADPGTNAEEISLAESANVTFSEAVPAELAALEDLNAANLDAATLDAAYLDAAPPEVSPDEQGLEPETPQ